MHCLTIPDPTNRFYPNDFTAPNSPKHSNIQFHRESKIRVLAKTIASTRKQRQYLRNSTDQAYQQIAILPSLS